MDDPDDTQGRRIYRARAEQIARFQMNMERMKPRLSRQPGSMTEQEMREGNFQCARRTIEGI